MSGNRLNDLSVLDHPQFVGLWTYREYGKQKRFSASVIIDGITAETAMKNTWIGALHEAANMLINSRPLLPPRK